MHCVTKTEEMFYFGKVLLNFVRIENTDYLRASQDKKACLHLTPISQSTDSELGNVVVRRPLGTRQVQPWF